MATSPRIPRNNDEFNKYFIKMCSYLSQGTPTNAERLGVLPEEVTKLTGFATQWTPIYSKFSDKRNGRTIASRDELGQIMFEVTDYEQKNRILDRIAASPNVTVEDLGVFNINSRILQKTKRTGAATRINEPVTITFQLLGGGSMTVKCYSSTAQRSGIFSEADSVQYVYKVGGTAPTSTDDIEMIKELSTRGTFPLDLGSGNSGKSLYIYFRWYCTKHPELAGPWSALQTSLIL